MKLSTAFNLQPHDIVAFVGGGGKTTAMFRLAREVVEAGGRVVVTTTTRIFAAQTALAPAQVVVEGAWGEGSSAKAQAEAALRAYGQVLVTGPVDAGEGKALGVSPEVMNALRDLPGAPVVVMEADGSRMRPFKAPASHEPVIPPETTLVVPVVGADVFGEPLGSERVHRPELVAVLGAWSLGQPVTPELVARVLAHPEGGLKGVPSEARVIPLINKVESEAELRLARETTVRLLAEARIEAVAIGAVRADEPVREAWGRVAAVVLAAGRSTRMGRPKQTLPWGEAQTLLGAVVERLRSGPVSEVIVVTGMAREAIEASLSQLAGAPGAPLRLTHNPDFADTEMARSLQVGLRALSPGIRAVLVALADQPELDLGVAEQVVQRWRETLAPVVAPFYQGQRGHPMLFDRAIWPAIHALPGDANPRAVLEAAGQLERVEAGSGAILRDIDTPADYQRAIDGGDIMPHA